MSLILLAIAIQGVLLIAIGRRLGFDSGPFVNFGLIVFGQIFLHILYDGGLVAEGDYFSYVAALIAALLFFWIAARRFRGATPAADRDEIDLVSMQACAAVFVIYTAIRVSQVSETLAYGWGGARLIVFKSNLPLTITHDLLQGIAYYYVAVCALRRNLLPLVLIGVLSIMSGSKQSLLIFLLEISFISRLVFGAGFVSLWKLVAVGVAGLVVSVLLFYGDDETFGSLSRFIEYRGDVYLYLFPLGFRDLLYGEYSWTSYFFHHTLRLVGSRVYEGPIGTMFFAHVFGTDLADTHGGPITPFFVVLDILFRAPAAVWYIACGALFGVFAAALFLIGARVFRQRRSLLDLLIGYWLMQSWYLITDPTVFSYRMTPIFWLLVGLMPFLLYRWARRRTVIRPVAGQVPGSTA